MIIDISRSLEERTAVFPGDVSFSRSKTMSIASGDSCNVSNVAGSSHAGTHVDLPLHFSDDKSVPGLDVFFGPAVVIETSDWEELASKSVPKGLRVLFKTTNSRTPFDYFDKDFFCLSSDAVRWLISAGAVLVGVDAPSVDPVTSEDLPNHHALRNANIAILENLGLSLVAPGEYELCALPLKIPGADATWVGAVLRK